MAKYYFDQDADLKDIAGETIAIIGYGNQGRSQALNLRDSGVSVIVGSPSDLSATRAVEDGFSVHLIAEAVRKASILFLLIPDEVLPAVYEKDIGPHLLSGMLLNFAHGYNIHYRHIQPPSIVDVIMIGPRMLGRGVRDTFVRGHGFPSLVAIHQDATGRAKARMLALAKGIGTTRMGAIESSFREETEIDLFSEQSADIHIPRMMFEVLTEAGFDPDVAILEIYASGELSELWAGARDLGLWHQLKLHSRTSQYGQQITGKQWLDFEGAKEQFRRVIGHIRSGKFEKEWTAEEVAGCRNLIAVTDENLKHPMQIAENRLYRMLGRRNYDLQDAYWLKGKSEPGKS